MQHNPYQSPGAELPPKQKPLKQPSVAYAVLAGVFTGLGAAVTLLLLDLYFDVTDLNWLGWPRYLAGWLEDIVLLFVSIGAAIRTIIGAIRKSIYKLRTSEPTTST